MIECIGISKYYGEKKAVDSLDLHVEEGKITVLIGPSGCGKSTTLRMINRLIEPDEGTILYKKKPVSEYKAEELRRNMGYAIQNTGLFPHWTVEQNICTVPRLMGWDKDRQKSRAKEMLELVGLEPDEYLKKYPSQLSGGEAQRVGVARALAADPPVVLMDEPFGATDPITRTRLQAEFIEIQKKLKKTVIFVTHDMEEAISLADSIAIMNDGKKIIHKSTEEILAETDNPFVKNFIGADSSIKRLSRYRAKDIIKKTADNSLGLAEIEPETTVKEALALLLAKGADKLYVRKTPNSPAGIISITDIRKLAQHHED